MINPIPTSSYRIQLREGVSFETVRDQLDYLLALGISHLYLSPIFAANPGSTHGYDIIDPNEIEADLGGRAGFEALAEAAHAHGLGVILDIVPNHTAFSLENPWLRDVLSHGPASRYAGHFDIDWDAGPLMLPFLPEPFAKMLAEDKFAAEDGCWLLDGLQIPLASDGPLGAISTAELAALHDRQHWRLKHWESERDSITHRRFFNVTGLIGMRVEDQNVFDDTHSLIIELVKSGHVDGLRVDHIDGLADPKAYLDMLATTLPQTPVWVEKILVGRESLPGSWQTAGTTGYESGRLIARLLTRDIAPLDSAWRDWSQDDGGFDAELAQAKLDILHNELAAELHQLVGLAGAALAQSPEVEPGPEGLREAVIALLSEMDRYRTYVDDNGVGPTDRAVIEAIVERARGKLRSARIVEALAGVWLDGQSAAAKAFSVRFQQVSGALLAKAQEDTAGFRWPRYLAANEVGAEPGEVNIGEVEANEFLAARRSSEMNLTSSHDTKRSEDARMRMVAISHHPQAFTQLVRRAGELDAATTVERAWQWYIAQSALGIWCAEPDALQARLADHIRKAMREAKQTTFWTRPVASIEDGAIAYAEALCKQWRRDEPEELEQLITTGAALSLTQVALKCVMPGFPDIYRGCEAPYFTLTDPDSRLPVDWAAMDTVEHGDGFAADKMTLTKTLLHLRRQEPEFFERASAQVSRAPDRLSLVRSAPERSLVVTQGTAMDGAACDVWQSQHGGMTLAIGWQQA